jgi:hypothetical protein
MVSCSIVEGPEEFIETNLAEVPPFPEQPSSSILNLAAVAAGVVLLAVAISAYQCGSMR